MLEQSRLSPPPALFARLSLIVSFVLVGLTLSFILDLPSQRLELSFLGSEASFTVSGTWFIALLLAALTSAGVDSIARTHPRVHLADRRYLFILWIVPAMIVVAATVILANTSVRVYGLIGVILAGAFLVAAILGEYFTIDLSDRLYNVAAQRESRGLFARDHHLWNDLRLEDSQSLFRDRHWICGGVSGARTLSRRGIGIAPHLALLCGGRTVHWGNSLGVQLLEFERTPGGSVAPGFLLPLHRIGAAAFVGTIESNRLV
jgi:hypothetical protein